MPTYVSLLNWTDSGIRSFKESPRRAKAAAALAEQMGGKLKEVYWTLGQYDLVSVIEAPDDETVMAVLLTLASEGNIRTVTMRGLDADEFQAAIDKAP